MEATGGTVSDYTEGSTNYRAHVFSASGSFQVNNLAVGDFPNNIDVVVISGGKAVVLILVVAAVLVVIDLSIRFLFLPLEHILNTGAGGGLQIATVQHFSRLQLGQS